MGVTVRNLFSLYEKHDNFVVIFMGAFLAMALLKKAVNLIIHVMKALGEHKKEKLARGKSAIELLLLAGWTTEEIKNYSKGDIQEIAKAAHVLEERVLSTAQKIDRAERVLFYSKVKLFVDSTQNNYNATTCDISEHGLKLRIPNLPALKSHCRIKVCLEEENTEIYGRMAWQDEIVVGEEVTPSTHIGVHLDAMIQLGKLFDKRDPGRPGS